jgi:hypothetical protein
MWGVNIFSTDICKSICDKWVTNFANMDLDTGYYFYKSRKTCSVKRLPISGLILNA